METLVYPEGSSAHSEAMLLCTQVFVNMKLVKHIDNKAVVADADKALSKAFAQLDAELSARQASSGPSQNPSPSSTTATLEAARSALSVPTPPKEVRLG